MCLGILGLACGVESRQRPSPVTSRAVSSSTYSAPDNAFTIKLPSDWKVQREEKDQGYLTVITHLQYSAANISVVTFNSRLPEFDTAEQRSHLLVEASKPFFQGWIGSLKEQARVEGTGQIYATRLAGLEALRTDVTYYRDDREDPRTGYSVFLVGNQQAFFISLTSSQSVFKELEYIISSIRIEP